MVSISFYFQVHQPRRIRHFTLFDIGKDINYFEGGHGKLDNKAIINKVSEKCYIPATRLWLKLLDEFPELKLSYSISGVLIEQLEEYRPDVLNLFQQLSDTKRVEFLSETYYHSLSFIYSKREFIKQVYLHKKTIKKYFNQTPKIFRNTELIYNNSIAKIAELMGFKGILAEGSEHILGHRNPNFVYKPKGSKISVLLRNYKLSDDISFRFSTPGWAEHPLTADKFAYWVSSINGNGTNVNLFMDYETFGEHQWEETGIFKFLEHLPNELLKHPDNEFATPSELVKKYKPVDELDVERITSWADTERDLSAWLGNEMQQTAINTLYGMEDSAVSSKDNHIKKDFGLLQTSDHFYYMCTKWFADGDVHKYFNPYDSPYEAFINYMNVLRDFHLRLDSSKKIKIKHNFLKEVPPDKKFFTIDGRELSNLIDLAFYLGICKKEHFDYHVKKSRNDFADWIENIIGDKKLARAIRKSRTPKSALRELTSRLKELIKDLKEVK